MLKKIGQGRENVYGSHLVHEDTEMRISPFRCLFFLFQYIETYPRFRVVQFLQQASFFDHPGLEPMLIKSICSDTDKDRSKIT